MKALVCINKGHNFYNLALTEISGICAEPINMRKNRLKLYSVCTVLNNTAIILDTVAVVVRTVQEFLTTIPSVL